MNEQNENRNDKENKELDSEPNKEKKKTKKQKLSGERKFYLFTAIGCAAVLIAIIIVAIAVTNSADVGNQGMNPPASSSQPSVPDNNEPELPDDNGPVIEVPEGMTLPLATVSVHHDYGFYHNQTLNNYYVHTGIDFAASAGAEVFAVEDGVVESIYKDDLLLGTEIVIRHDDGLKSVYRFVTETEGLKVGAEVKKGEVIATVAEATGNEYKDGAHLHFELHENGKSVDPTMYLTLEEK